MSNASIIQRMREACDRYEAGQLSPAVLGKQLVALAEALEGVGRRVVEEMREYEFRLLAAQDDLDYEDEERARTACQAIVADIRPWLERVSEVG
jgi:hypothetical protein